MLNPQPAPAIDTAAFEVLVEMIGPEEPAAVLDLLDTYLDESSRQISDLQAAFTTGDLTNVYRIAHSMKSSSATFGATELSKYCGQLESSARENCTNGKCEQQLARVCDEHVRVVTALTAERSRFVE